MSVIKKCDVEDYLAARRRGKSRLYLRTSPGERKSSQFKVEDKAIPLRKVEPGEPDPIARAPLSDRPSSRRQLDQEDLPNCGRI